MKLKLADDLSLPADEAVTQKYGFIGRSGSGKSYASMKLAELFLDNGAQIIALDWVGIWWSLRLAADGKTPGFEHVYIFGGEHADVALQPESGALMADLVVDKHISVVLDVMHFRKAERTRFATAFAEQFFHRKKTARTACHLFIEEAQAYLPQMVRGDEARMVGVFEDIGKVGRNYGIGSSLISQRPQSINKDVLNQVEVLLAFQTNGPQERKAIAGWTAENTDAGAAMIQELPKLHVGDALVWSPQWLRVAKQVHIAERVTYDASSTPTQKAKAIRPKTLAAADLAQLGEQITATIERAKADDPRELRKQIAELTKQLAAKVSDRFVAAVAPKTVEKFVLKDGQLARAEKLVDTIHGTLDRVNALRGQLENYRTQLFEAVEPIVAAIASTREPHPYTHATMTQAVVTPRQAPVMSTRVHRAVPAATASRPVHAVSPPSNGNLAPARQKILDALAFFQGIGVSKVDKVQLSLMAGVPHTSGGYKNNLGALRTDGYIEYPTPGDVALTDVGRAVASADGVPQTTDELHEAIKAKLPPAKWKILDVLIGHYPNAMAKEELAERCGVPDTSGGYKNNLGSLRSLGLIGYPQPGTVAAQPMLFLDESELR